jgi:hypothetical protein
MAEIDPATELGMWVVQNLGLRVEVWDGTWQPVGRIADTGPIAWGDVGFVVRTGMRDSLRVRLSFPFDSWRIDRVAPFADVARSPVRSHDPARAIDVTGATLGSALASLAAVDERYVVTGPGQRFFVEFDTGVPSEGETRTYFLVSHGYYTEWIRPAWIGRSPAAPGFTPGNGTLLQALRSWWSQRNEMESRFFESRVPIASGAEAVR